MTVLHPKGDSGTTFKLKISCDRSVENLKVLRAGETSTPNHFVVHVASKHGCPTNKIKLDHSKPASGYSYFNCKDILVGGMFFDFTPLFNFEGDYTAQFGGDKAVNFNMCYTTNKYCKKFGYANLFKTDVMDECSVLANG